MKKTKTKICAIALTGALAVSALSIGFAAWKTDITANGNVTANGKWEVVVTDANIEVSNGASYTNTKTEYTTEYAIARTGAKGDSLIASVITAETKAWVNDEALVGTQSNEAMSKYTYYYAIDTTKHDLANLNTLTADERAAIVDDATTVTVSDELKGYYRFVNGQYSTENSAKWSTMVVDGFLSDMADLLEERYPDTYQNYVIASIGTGLPSSNFIMAKYEETKMPVEVETDEAAVISEDGLSIDYADVAFGLPGAWAQYSLTVANNGTVDATLSDIIIDLETESDQLVLEKSDLTDEVLKAGESCTITFNVYVPEEVTEDLDAVGTLTVKLPYAQAEVEARPVPTHTHN